ncbi:MAG TPA: PEP-utilizing enzyme [Patescibacteria group bacterium]|nr:PEP-utilizing enzyme [Patescibacteria group bacterium]
MKKLLLTGIPANSGTAQGRAKLFFPGNSAAEFNDGDILVTTLTDPTMVGAMIKAAAIVTDIGGITSHPAILSREMGIPCVVNTKNATTLIKDGMLIVVDGEKGEVYALDS